MRRFAGVILLDLLMVAPMLLGLGEAFAALLTKKSPSIMSLIAMLVGVWFFVRLNLTVVHYLSTQEALSQTIRKIWMRGNTRKGVLFYLHPTGLFSRANSYFPIKRIFQ